MLVAGLSLATLVFAAPVRAEDAPAKGGDKPAKKEGGQRQGPAERLQKNLDSLNLTDDQKKKIDPIVTKLKEDMKTLMSDQTIEQKDKRAKAADILKSANTEIEAVLTPEQKEQYEKNMQAEHAKRGGGEKKGGDKGDKGANKPAN